MRLPIFILFITLVFVNTAAIANPPDWVNGRSNRFPEGLYLVGVGQSDSRSGAEADAQASIAKIFRTQIEQQTADWEKYLQIESRGKTKIEQKRSIESLTKVSTDKVIEGVQIVETAQDGSTYYALAMIDRLQATASLTERIAELNQKGEEDIALARKSPDKLSRIKNYKRAIKTLLLRDATNIDLQVVNVKGGGILSMVSSNSVVQEFDEWLTNNFLIDVKVSGAQGSVVQKAIIESLLREGFPIYGGAEGKGKSGGFEDIEDKSSGTLGSDLFVKGDVTLTNVAIPGQPFKYVRWCVDLTVFETKENQIIGVVAKSGREGHISSSEAEARAVRILQSAVVGDVGERLAEYFTGEFQPILNRSSSCAKEAG